jgi:hypothetical protein
MADVSEVYEQPYDEKRRLPVEPRQPESFDYEYVRNGMADLFMTSEPLLGWRAVQTTKRRTAEDFAEVLRWLVEDVHGDADKIVLATEDLSTHTAAALYHAFAPEQARRIAQRIEWHYTPKHGNWLIRAEIELSVLSRQRQDHCIGTGGEMAAAVGAWDKRCVEVQWCFTTADLHTKLHRLHPSLQEWRTTNGGWSRSIGDSWIRMADVKLRLSCAKLPSSLKLRRMAFPPWDAAQRFDLAPPSRSTPADRYEAKSSFRKPGGQFVDRRRL